MVSERKRKSRHFSSNNEKTAIPLLCIQKGEFRITGRHIYKLYLQTGVFAKILKKLHYNLAETKKILFLFLERNLID